jgi:cardiolipin synthase
MYPDLQPPAVRRASYPPRTGCRVRVHIDGDETFRAIGARVEAATRSIWVTVSFVDLALDVFGEGMSLLASLDRAASRGVDVRLLFWWSEFPGIGSFRGDPDELDELARRGVRAKMRWDHVPRGCHHQKSWVIDGKVAFVGGINITADALSTPAHDGEGHHDLFAEIEGPAVADVAENFVQRWNQASRYDGRGHAFPSTDIADAVATIASPSGVGTTTVQIVRTIRHGLYRGPRGWSGAHLFDLQDGEHAIRETLHRWIDAAERFVYVENQYLLAPDTLDALTRAAARGVDVIVVCPWKPDPNLVLYPEENLRETLAALDALAARSRFALFGLSRPGSKDVPIYVHAKLMIVDDRLMSIGSANHWPPSYTRDSELNACMWDSELAADTRRRLWTEHLGDSKRVAGIETEGAGYVAGWRRLASNRPPGARIVEIDASKYYRFSNDVVAPWARIEPRE